MKLYFKIILVLCSCLLSLLLAEGFLRVYFDYRTNYDIEMWRYTLRLKQAVPDRRSHIHVPNRSAHLMNVDLDINSKGLRDREIAYEKPASTYRILLLGDSVTLGWGVPLQETFARRIQNQLKLPGIQNIETVNMGVGNYNLEQEIEAYLREGRKYHPDAVLLFYHITDAEPTQKHPSNFFLNRSYLFAFLVQRFYQIKPYLQHGNHYIAFYQKFYEGPAFKDFQPTLDEIVNVTAADKVKLVPVILPEFRSLENYPFKGYHDAMVGYFTQHGIGSIDLRSEFEGRHSKDFLVAFDDPHPNAAAHALIAEAIVSEIEKRSLLP